MERDNNRDNRDNRDKKPYNKNLKRPRKKVCSFCVDKVEDINYKDVAKLRRFLSERGKIVPRRVTGCCAYHQRKLTISIKRARHLAFLPYVND